MNKAAMMIRTSSLLFLVLLLGIGDAAAQRRRQPAQKPKPQPKPAAPIIRTDTTIKSTTLEVYQQYEPELKPITKPELTPSLLPPPEQRMPQQYDVPQQTLYYSYRALPLRPLALGKDTAQVPHANYALLAGGNLSTVLGEVGIGGLRGRNWQSAIHGRYITQEGDPGDQVYRSFKLRGDGTAEWKDHLWEAGLDVQRSVFGAYGYDHEALKYDFGDVKRVYTGAVVSLGMQNQTPAWQGLSYHPDVSFSYFTGSTLDNERSLTVRLPAKKQIDSNLSAELGLNAWITGSNTGPDGWYNTVFQLTPRVSYARNAFSGHIGLYPTRASGSYHLLPDIAARYRVSDALVASAGWQATYVQNTIRQLTTANPFYLVAPSDRQQTRTDDVFAGLSLALGRHLTVTGRVAWNSWHGLPLFVTKPGGDGKDFRVVYDADVRAIVWNAGVRYAIGEDISLSAEGTWYNYYEHSFSRVWGEPGVRLKGRAAWQALRGLQLNVYTELLDQIWGLDAQQKEVKLRGVFEFGAGAEYTIVERLSVLLRAENLLGRRNERWQGYPAFGFNVYGGARFRF